MSPATAMTCVPVRAGVMRTTNAFFRPAIAMGGRISAREAPQRKPFERIPATLAVQGQRDVADALCWQPGRIAPR
ncbi:hypothetical protein [Pseudoxanthomonas sp. z9]|uniref:hypothetical protein n=1 Tax=Pseudoxanthomonas sp. z9 TaxID=2584942 RepID=UPI0011417AEE|nr:hypothetical protein [Pseudoxanthomonas sp. z9]